MLIAMVAMETLPLVVGVLLVVIAAPAIAGFRKRLAAIAVRLPLAGNDEAAYSAAFAAVSIVCALVGLAWVLTSL